MLNELLIKDLSDKVETNTSDIQGIKDAEVYSTSEIKTNKKWIDGKPIYRKTFTGTTENDGTTLITSEFNDNSITLIKSYGQVRSMQVGGYINDRWYNSAYLNVNGLNIYHSNELNGCSYNLTIEYIKN